MVKGLDQILQSRNYCYSSIRVVPIDEIKSSLRKITMSQIQIVCSNCIILCAGKQEAGSAEVEALATVFKKSATKLKPKTKFLRSKNIVNIVVFNVRMLNSVNQLPPG